MPRQSAAGDAPDPQPQSVTTWDGFQAFATTPVAAPPPPGAPPCSLKERLAYYSRFVTVRTPTIDALAKNVRTLMILGRHQTVTARPSLIVTGPASAGKSTALLQVGRACHLAHTRRHGATAAAGQVPFAYVLVPPAASAKTPAAQFARCLGIPVAAGMSQAQITHADRPRTPPTAELHLSPAACHRLAALAHIPLRHLTHVLPLLAPHHTAAAAHWKRLESGQQPVRACTLCTRHRSHDATNTAWVHRPPHRLVCPRHQQAAPDPRLTSTIQTWAAPRLSAEPISVEPTTDIESFCAR